MTTHVADDRAEWSSTTITSWVTPRLEQILNRAAEIANENGYNYLGDEHVLLAMLEIDNTQLHRSWTAESPPLTDLRRRILDSLPPRSKPNTSAQANRSRLRPGVSAPPTCSCVRLGWDRRTAYTYRSHPIR